MSDKKSILIYHDWLEAFEDLNDEEFGSLIRALLEFDMSGSEASFDDRAVKLAFKQMKAVIKANKDAYEKKCEKMRNNASKKYEKHDVQLNTIACKSIQRHTEAGDKDKDKDKDKDIIISDVCVSSNNNIYIGELDEKHETHDTHTPESEIKHSISPLNEIIAEWNALAFTKKIKSIPPKSVRMDNMNRCVDKVQGIYRFIDVIKNLPEQKYLASKSNVEFDWLIEPDNFQKVLGCCYKEIFKPPEKKNQLKDFDQRKYSDEFFKEIEKKMSEQEGI